jgi:predicted glycosyltransferase
MAGTRVLVRGLPGNFADAPPVRTGELNVFDHLPGARLHALMRAAESVVCRSGYTTVMELAGMGRSGVLFVATPGQSEQEYLAAHAEAAGLAARLDQGALTGSDALEAGLRAAAPLPGFRRFSSSPENSLTAWVREHPLLTQ